jgi:glutamate-1-semialdehyde 2,1-aminomutase/spore coat polysaccharide biosynthesis protein SpsF
MSENDGSLTSEYFYNRTCKVIPDGVQTLSKMPTKQVEGVYPIYLEGGTGAYVFDERGNSYIDYPCGLGSILLGYGRREISDVVNERIRKGHLFSLPHKLETELAEKICELIPCAEMVRFLKTGSEATSAAVKIARAYTGRQSVLCCGYHGWHDWYNVVTDKNAGAARNGLTRRFKYNNLQSLRQQFNNFKGSMSGLVAAVIMEPYVYNPPDDGYLQAVRDMCDEYGALLIFDEVVTGFRTKAYSAQAYYGVTPDLCTLGKAMANGMPISCVAGKEKIMKVLTEDCFVSSTFGGELLSIVAALETIRIMEQENGIKKIWYYGEAFKEGFERAAEGLAECIGLPPRTYFRFPTPEHKSLFWQECIKRGVLFGHAQFISLAHTEPVMAETISVMEDAFAATKNHWDNPANGLEGKVAQETLRMAR